MLAYGFAAPQLCSNLAVPLAQAHVGDEHGQLDDVRQTAPGFLHDRRQFLERSTSLDTDVG
jgi:hypothetical protein